VAGDGGEQGDGDSGRVGVMAGMLMEETKWEKVSSACPRAKLSMATHVWWRQRSVVQRQRCHGDVRGRDRAALFEQCWHGR
jgi:hypothetical protein